MIALILSTLLWMANANETPVQWLTGTEHDFGDIRQKEPVRHTFTFQNRGNTPLVIETVRTSCGCTGSTWTETPVAPDSTGTVLLEYDAKQGGYFNKSAKIFFEGTRSAEKVWVSGFVLEE